MSRVLPASQADESTPIFKFFSYKRKQVVRVPPTAAQVSHEEALLELMYMGSGNYENLKHDDRYNYQHVYFVSKKRYKVFKKEKTREVCKVAFYESAKRFGFEIREFGFGEDYAHVHMIVNVPSKFSVQQAIQIFKSHSSSVIFEKIPNFLKRYPDREFWSGWR